ncbi:MAG: DegQ family serine endoprotease [Alphaproteobacteria bacterium]|nr:DegQ family serine endoprotease [Alphaproteobacteria bacterium]MBU0797522.1 DegQ family serine endoprotease [Alphaproteobacteria bacterium]MBU0887715.1 DegQ family serine endoprotease [Alphaproteobacteria bacterium]MBU1813233.1 DegQ family serine endoprotease [Alphaproteobacteria bacterium]
MSNRLAPLFSTGRATPGTSTGIKRLGAAVLVALLTLPALPALARSAPDSFADLAEKLLPSVVNVSTTQNVQPSQEMPEMPQFPPGSPFEEFFKDFFERNQPNQSRRATSLGSGFVIDGTGLIVTNNHVIADADKVSVRFHDDREFDAEIVGRDPKTDMALLRIKPGDYKLHAVPWGNSDETRVGDWVVAIGNPFGLGGTVTAGIVSARARDINAGPYDDFLQTDASINRGNSGGPMFNMNGEVIGINTAIYSPSGGSIGIGFAVPAALAKPVIEQLKEYGRTRRGWLGVRIQMVTDEIAESLGLDKARGALVASITEKGPADAAGIKAGDIILKFNGTNVPDMRRLPRIVAATKIEESVPVELWRDGKRVTVQAKVGELEEAEQAGLLDPTAPADSGKPSQTVDTLGLGLSAVTPELKQKFGLADNARGVLVTEVKPNSPAAEKAIQPGDMIVEVSQEEVKTSAQVLEKVQAAQKAGRKSVLLLVERKGEMRFVALRIEG